jgi:hypothetical protein
MRCNQSEIEQPREITVIISDSHIQTIEKWAIFLAVMLLGVIIIFD